MAVAPSCRGAVLNPTAATLRKRLEAIGPNRRGADAEADAICVSNAALGNGHVDLAAVFGTLEERGYRGWIGVEPAEVFDDDADRWLNPLDAGSLLHTVLERFMRGIIDKNRKTVGGT